MTVCTVSQGKGASVCRGLGQKEDKKRGSNTGETRNRSKTEGSLRACPELFKPLQYEADCQPKPSTLKPCFLSYIFRGSNVREGTEMWKSFAYSYTTTPPNLFLLPVTCQTHLWHLTADKMMGRG